MGKQTQALIMLFSILMAIFTMVLGYEEGPKAVEAWFQKFPHAKEKVTKLHFFFHDTLSGKRPTAQQVAQAKTTFTSSPTLFGLVNMFDDPLTAGPEPTSKIVGRAQGFYASADLSDVGLLMNLNYVFTEGNFKGSTLSILGRNQALHKYREMPILGGTGVFRLARGIATAKTYFYNDTTGDAVVEYDVMVVHY